MWQNTCDNSTFGVRVLSWDGVQNISLDLKHTYIDERYNLNGEPRVFGFN